MEFQKLNTYIVLLIAFWMKKYLEVRFLCTTENIVQCQNKVCPSLCGVKTFICNFASPGQEQIKIIMGVGEESPRTLLRSTKGRENFHWCHLYISYKMIFAELIYLHPLDLIPTASRHYVTQLSLLTNQSFSFSYAPSPQK